MAKTRSRGAALGTAKTEQKNTPAKTSSSSIYALSPESDSPPMLFILPKTASSSARIITLQHPRHNKPARFLVCPEAGFFEFTTISPPKSAPRSWLIQPTPPPDAATDDNPNPNPAAQQQPAQTIQSPALHLATPYDPLFLLLPALCADVSSSSQPPKKKMFLSLDDHLDAATASAADPSNHLSDVLAASPAARRLVEARMRAVCDVVQAGDDDMYRASERGVLAEVLGKARRMVEGGGALPGSLEERFVRRALEAPVLGVRVARGQQSGSAVAEADDGVASGSGSGSGSVTTPSLESQASVSSVETVQSAASEVSATSTAATSVADEGVASAMTASDEVVALQRLRVAFDFICANCVAPPIAGALKAQLAKATDLVDFRPLDEYLERLAKLRQEASAARAADFSRKREADEEADERAEKRRKKEAEDKAKKANMSRGVKNLMKVNTSGMKKMSDFFKKKT